MLMLTAIIVLNGIYDFGITSILLIWTLYDQFMLISSLLFCYKDLTDLHYAIMLSEFHLTF